MFRAVVFDFDGLIMDTETPQYEAWFDTFRSRGQDLPLAVWGKASDALAFEDSPHGAMAALNAGLTCVVVTNPTTKPLSFPASHRKLETMTETLSCRS